jgi:hypothetical protein
MPAPIRTARVCAGSASSLVWHGLFGRVPSQHMDTLVINISWEYFLGIMGGLIAIAYYSNGRFTALETTVVWLKELLTDLLLTAENQEAKLFKNGSPVSLTSKGYHALARSGLRSYIDANKKRLLSQLGDLAPDNRYDVQRQAFNFLAELSFEDPLERHLNSFAFANGMSATLLRRVGAIYLRDLIVQSD